MPGHAQWLSLRWQQQQHVAQMALLLPPQAQQHGVHHLRFPPLPSRHHESELGAGCWTESQLPAACRQWSLQEWKAGLQARLAPGYLLVVPQLMRWLLGRLER